MMQKSDHNTLGMLRRLTGRFQVQLMLRFLAIVMLLAIVVSMVFFHKMFSEQMDREALLLREQAQGHMILLDSRVKAVEGDAAAILANNTIKNYLTYPYGKPSQKVQDALYSFQPLIRWVMTINTQYLRIRFLTENTATTGDTFVDSLTTYADVPWVQATLNSPSKDLWQNLHVPQHYRYTYRMEDEVATYSLYNSLGSYLVALDISAPWLYQEIPFVLDTDTGRVLFSSLAAKSFGQTVELHDDQTLCTALIDNKEYYVHAIEHDELNVTLLACTERAPVHEAIHSSSHIFTLWTVLFILAACVLLFLTSYSVVTRMSLISRNVSQITKGSYDVSYPVTRNDELDDLGADIVNMAGQMNWLVNQRLNQQMLLQEAEFRALQEQINPHFIFNILQTMQMMAEMNDQTELADMIAQFGSMVRYNLYASENVPLEEELANVKDYLMLQKAMYNDELEMTIDVLDVPDDLELPRLLLQPLVENAVQHGRIKGQILHVEIRGYRSDKGICMHIRNNGKQLTATQEAELQHVLEEVRNNPGSVDGGNAKNNLALINIQKRLLIRFGPQCHLKVYNDIDGTVLVEFIIPHKGD